MSARRGLIALAAAVVLCRADVARAGDGSAPGAPAVSGMVIYRDPVTGKLGVPPADVAAQLDPRAARRPAAMVERPGTTAGGGTLLDGVPPMAVTATADGQRKVSTRCARRLDGEQE